MIGLERLIRVARKWQQIAAVRIKRISYSRLNSRMDLNKGNPSSEKGHFVVYTADCKRFEIPLAYLGNEIFRKLFKMSGEEFGVSSDRPITFPCDSAYTDCVLELIRRGIAKDSEKVLINSITTGQYCSISASSGHGHAFKTCLSSKLCLN